MSCSGKCFICGATVEDGSSLCSWQCESRADEQKKWEGKDPCQQCMETSDECDWEPATVGDLCASHAEQANEAAYERSVEAFYGSSAPQTIQEQQDAARRAR